MAGAKIPLGDVVQWIHSCFLDEIREQCPDAELWLGMPTRVAPTEAANGLKWLFQISGCAPDGVCGIVKSVGETPDFSKLQDRFALELKKKGRELELGPVLAAQEIPRQAVWFPAEIGLGPKAKVQKMFLIVGA